MMVWGLTATIARATIARRWQYRDVCTLTLAWRSVLALALASTSPLVLKLAAVSGSSSLCQTERGGGGECNNRWKVIHHIVREAPSVERYTSGDLVRIQPVPMHRYRVPGAPSLRPATVPLTPSASLNGICNRQ